MHCEIRLGSSLKMSRFTLDSKGKFNIEKNCTGLQQIIFKGNVEERREKTFQKMKSIACRLKLVSEHSEKSQDYITSPYFLGIFPKILVLPRIRADTLEHLDATLHLLKIRQTRENKKYLPT